MNPRLPAVLSLLLLLATWGSAQAQGPAATIRCAVPRGLWPRADVDRFGAFWAAGDDYKIGVREQGALFLPRVGNASSHRPLELRLAAATVAGDPLPLASKPALRADGATVRLAHGPLEEVWTLRAEAAEQDFVLAAPVGTGELVLTLAVKTEMVCQREGDHLEFVAPGVVTVSYRDLVVKDAAGQELRAPIAWRDGAIELRVPAAFLAAAAYPVVVDPRVTVNTFGNSPADETTPDVAYDHSTSAWLVTYTRVSARGDRDVIAHRVNAAGSLVDTLLIDLSNRDAVTPSVANNARGNQFLVVWQEIGTFDSDVLGRSVSASTGTLGATLTIGATGNDDLDPDVGGTSDSVGTRYLVGWARNQSFGNEDQILLRTVDTAGNLGALITLDPAAGCTQNHHVAISKSAGPGLCWGVAYAHPRGGCQATPVDVAFAVVATGGSVQFGPSFVGPSTGLDDRPEVAGSGDDFLVVMEHATPRDLFGVGYQRTGATAFARTLGPLDLSTLEPGVDPSVIQRQPCVDWDGCRFTYCYGDGNVPSLRLATVAFLGSSLAFHAAHQVVNGAQSLNETQPRMACAGSAGGSAARCMIVFQKPQPTDEDVIGVLFDAVGPTPVSFANTGCGSTSEPGLTVTGLAGLGLTARVDLTATGVPLLLAGPLLPAPLPLCTSARGPCALGVASFQVVVAGSSLSLPIPCDLGLYGAVLAVQGLDLLTAGGCAASAFGLDFRTSNTALITVQ